jgi:hypothetical protein
VDGGGGQTGRSSSRFVGGLWSVVEAFPHLLKKRTKFFFSLLVFLELGELRFGFLEISELAILWRRGVRVQLEA